MKLKNLDEMSIEELAELYFELSSNCSNESSDEAVTMLTQIMDKASNDAELTKEISKADNKLLNLYYN